MNPGETERCEVCQGYPEWCENCTLRLYMLHLNEERIRQSQAEKGEAVNA